MKSVLTGEQMWVYRETGEKHGGDLRPFSVEVSADGPDDVRALMNPETKEIIVLRNVRTSNPKLIPAALLMVFLCSFGCAPEMNSTAAEIGTVTSVYRADRTDHYEIVVSCSDGYDWTLSDRNVNPGGYGTGEFRIREVFDGADRVVGYGGLGYLMNAANWIAGGHGYATEPLGAIHTPYLEPDETANAAALAATFTAVGYNAGDAVVALSYGVTFDCSTYVEHVSARALVGFDLDFEYVAVAVGPGECLVTGAYDTVNGVSGYGCATATAYTYLDESQVLELEGDGHRLTVTTDVPLSELDHTLVRDQSTPAIKAYAVRGARSISAGDTWSVENTYRLERLVP